MSTKTSWLFIHSSDELYGADRVLLLVLESLPTHLRDNARVWLPSDLEHGGFPLCERIRAMGIRVDHVPLPILRRALINPRGLAALSQRGLAFRSAVKKIHPDVVYCTTSATLPAAAALRAAGPLIVFHNQEVWEGKESTLMGVMARTADRVIAVSESARDSMPAAVATRTIVVANACPDPTISTTFRFLTEIPSEPIKFLAAGRWTSRKGFDVLLDAWAQSVPGQLTIVGGPPPTGESIDVRGLVDALPDPSSVTLVGEVESIAELISQSHVMVMPSKLSESFGLVALEAMSAGRPVVASAVGGLQELVSRDVGWLVPPANAEALAETLRAITPAEIVWRGANGRARYEESFSEQSYRHNWRAAMGLAP